MSSGSQPAQTTTSTTNTTPWSAQQPYLTDIFQQGQNLAQTNPITPYTGETVAPFSPAQNQAMSMTQNLVNQGGPQITQDATSSLTPFLNGSYLSANNPYFQQMAATTAANVLPQINSQFANSGGQGGLQARAQGQGLGDAIGNLAYQNYNQGMSNMLGAQAYAPALGQQPYTNIAALSDVGAAQQGQQQQLTNEQIQKFQAGQQDPWQTLGLYQGAVSGNYGGTTTGSNSQTIASPNPLTQILGGLTAGAGIAGSLFSDERLKTDIKEVGETKDGLPIYTYKYIWGGPPQMGVMAQDALEKHPEAVGSFGDFLTVDYSRID